MVNAGAVATTSLVPGETADDRWGFIRDGLSLFAGRFLSLNTEVYASALETKFKNQSLARLLHTSGRIYLCAGDARFVYQAVFAQRQRQGPGGDGCYPRGWRRQSLDQGARR